MPKPYVISNGWFSEVYGHAVKKHDCDEPGMSAFDYRPIGIMEHYTAGCGDNLSDLMRSRGYVICTFSIDRDGTIRQYTPLFRGAWHAYDASEKYVGIEHAGLPGSCNLTKDSLASSIKLNAAIVVACRDLRDINIPLKHIGGCNIGAAGFKEHVDGAIPDRCFWNESVHVDNPVGVMYGAKAGTANNGWSKFFEDIDATMRGGGDDLNDEEHSWLEQTKDLVKNYVRGVVGHSKVGDSDQAGSGHNAGEFVRNKLIELDNRVTRIEEGSGGGR
jgi:N-acetylmuramoyl-L-alanine amidase-like protein